MTVWLPALLALLLAVGLLWQWRRTRRRRQVLQSEPLSEPEQILLETRIAAAAWMSPVQRARWHRQVQRFRHGKRWLACGGHLLDEEQRLLIAGLACLLRLQDDAERQPLFPEVRELLIYPEAFLVPPPHEPLDEGLELVDDAPDERIGEQGPGQVVLSWADVEAALAGDPVNVVVHEFAHALDEENPSGEGAPPMPRELAAEWAEVMGAEYARLQRHRRQPVLDKYGAQSPGEFFGVVSEAYFQQPAALRRHHPALFALLQRYYGLTAPADRES